MLAQIVGNAHATPLAALAIVSSGIVAHRSHFRRGEWDIAAPHIALAYVLTYLCSVWFILSASADASLYSATASAALILGLHLFGLVSSICLYRLYQHPLQPFPGPGLAKVTSAYAIWLTVRNWHLYDELQSLHRAYGDFVRIAPNTLSITHPLAVSAIHGARAPVTKGPMYDIAHPRHTLHFLRDKQQHAHRRRDWRRAFTPQALSSYRPRVQACADELMSIFAEHADSSRPINAALFFNLFSFDAMGLVGFNHSFNRLSARKMDYYMHSLHRNTLMAGTFFQAPWVMQILKQIPVFNMQYTAFIAYSKRIAEERIQTRSAKDATIFSPIVEAYEAKRNKNKKEQKTPQDRLDLYGDADLIVVAGSDTIAATLTCACFELARHPAQIRRVRTLLRRDGPAAQRHADSHIEAIVRETLRLHPVIASGLQRVTPPEGLVVGDTLIPGGMRVQTPTHVMQRDARFFAQPDAFIPERWTTRRELVLDASVYVPFNTGIYSCLGEKLAMLELDIVVRRLCMQFDWSLVGEIEATERKFEQAKRDTFTLFVRDLPVVLHKAPSSLE